MPRHLGAWQSQVLLQILPLVDTLLLDVKLAGNPSERRQSMDLTLT